MYFLVLSQAPPVLDIEIAIYIPDTIAPANKPQTPLPPKRKPVTIGDKITKAPGAIMCLMLALVEIAMHFS